MHKNSLYTVGLICALCLVTSTAFAQRGGGQRGGGGMQGGGGGCVRSGGTGSGTGTIAAGQGFRMGGGMNGNIMAAFGNMNRPGPPPMMGSNFNQANRNPPPNRPPTPQQFAVAAMRMDRDGDKKLNREELINVASAVMAELNRRPQPPFEQPHVPTGIKRTPDATSVEPTDLNAEMTEAFVNRCLEFDSNKDGALNLAETRVMAAALIKSLG